MCGRYTLAGPGDGALAALRARFGLDERLDVRQRFNVAPGDDVVAVRTGRDGARRGDVLRWGLVPHWAESPRLGARMINARAETLAEKPAFRDALARRRCLVVADGFYEWERRDGARKQPWWITRADGEPFAFAGLWATWRPGRRRGRRPALRSCTIVTTAANAAVAPLHDRMPVILPAGAEATWLDPATPDGGGAGAAGAPRSGRDRPAPGRDGRQRRAPRRAGLPGPARGGRRAAPRRCSRRPVELSRRVAGYDHLLLDLDGCVWVGDEPTPGAVEAVDALRAAGRGLAFVTNDGRHGRGGRRAQALAPRLPGRERGGRHRRRRGAVRLREPGWRSAVVIGAPAIHRHVADAGLAILNGGDLARRGRRRRRRRARGLRLRGAARGDAGALVRGAALVAAGRDATFPMPDGPWPGTGPVVAALEAATGVDGAQRRQARAGPLPHGAGPAGPGPRARRRRPPRRRRPGARAAGVDGAVVLTGATTAAAARRPSRRRRRRRHAGRARARVGPGAGLRRWRAAWTGPSASSSTPPPAAVAPLRALPGGRGAPARPRRRRAHRRRRATSTTRRELAVAAADAGELPVAVLGRRADRRRRAARCATAPGAMLGRAARRARQRLRARAAASRSIPSRRATCWPTAAARPSTSARPAAAPFIGIASLGFDSRRQPDRQRGAVAPRRRSSTSTARCGPWPRGSPRRFTSTSTATRAHLRRLERRAPRTPRPTAAACTSRPTAELDDGRARRRPVPTARRKRGSCAGAARASSRARTSSSRSVDVLRGAEVRIERRPARSWSTPTATRSASCRSRSRVAPERAAGGGAGVSAAGGQGRRRARRRRGSRA